MYAEIADPSLLNGVNTAATKPLISNDRDSYTEDNDIIISTACTCMEHK